MMSEPQPRRRMAFGLGALGLALALVLVGGRYWLAGSPAAKANARAGEGTPPEFQALGPDDPLDAYLPYFETDHWEQATAAIRHVRTRQEDAARLLRADTPPTQTYALSQFDVAATPDLCDAYQAAMNRWLVEFGAGPPFPPIIELYVHADNLRWFIANGCDVRPQALSIAELLRRDGEFPAYADELEKIGRSPIGVPAAG